MKKFYIGIGIVISLLLINFSLWFFHTKTIYSTLNTAKTKLAAIGIDLEYEDIIFSNFNSFRVRGMLTHPKITQNGAPSRSFQFKNIEFVSNPYANTFKLRIHDDVQYTRLNGAEVDEFKIIFQEIPVFEIEFNTSLYKLINKVDDPEEGTPFEDIGTVTTEIAGFDIIDVKNKQKYLKVGATNLLIDSMSNKENEQIKVNLSIDGVEYDKDYMVKRDIEQHEEAVRMGRSSFIMNLIYQNSFSEYQKKLDKKERVFDAIKLKVENLEVKTALFSASLTGEVDKQPGSIFPYTDLTLKVQNYKELVDHYVNWLNFSIREIRERQPIIPVKEISQAQALAAKDIIGRLIASQEGDITTFTFQRSHTHPFTISGKPADSIWKEVQALFLGSIGVEERAHLRQGRQ
jgi:hypothetical protein